MTKFWKNLLVVLVAASIAVVCYSFGSKNHWHEAAQSLPHVATAEEDVATATPKPVATATTPKPVATTTPTATPKLTETAAVEEYFMEYIFGTPQKAPLLLNEKGKPFLLKETEIQEGTTIEWIRVAPESNQFKNYTCDECEPGRFRNRQRNSALFASEEAVYQASLVRVEYLATDVAREFGPDMKSLFESTIIELPNGSVVMRQCVGGDTLVATVYFSNGSLGIYRTQEGKLGFRACPGHGAVIPTPQSNIVTDWKDDGPESLPQPTMTTQPITESAHNPDPPVHNNSDPVVHSNPTTGHNDVAPTFKPR